MARTQKTTDTYLEELKEKTKNKIKIKINVADYGTMRAELYPDIAPITVANFVKLIESGFYSGLVFHRVIAGFMIQGGGFDTNGQHKDAESIKGEFAANGVKNILKHEKGVLSMARTSDPNSASSQIFIMHDYAPHLDGQYAAFGKVVDADLEIIDRIAKTRTTTKMFYYQDWPVDDIVIESVELA